MSRQVDSCGSIGGERHLSSGVTARRDGNQKGERQVSEAGHNSELTENELKALYLQYADERAEADAACKAANDRKTTINRKAKADGIKTKDLDRFIEMRNAEDEAAKTESVKLQVQFAKWLNLENAGQLELFEVDRRTDVEKAKEMGYSHGFRGIGPHSPYGQGTAQDDAYSEAWREGTDARTDALKSAEEKLETQREEAAKPKRRGRPPRSRDDEIAEASEGVEVTPTPNATVVQFEQEVEAEAAE